MCTTYKSTTVDSTRDKLNWSQISTTVVKYVSVEIGSADHEYKTVSFFCSVSPTYHDGTGSDHDPGDFERANLQGDHAPSSTEDQQERQGDQHDLHRHRDCDLVRRLQLAKVGAQSTFQSASRWHVIYWTLSGKLAQYYCFHAYVCMYVLTMYFQFPLEDRRHRTHPR